MAKKLIGIGLALAVTLCCLSACGGNIPTVSTTSLPLQVPPSSTLSNSTIQEEDLLRQAYDNAEPWRQAVYDLAVSLIDWDQAPEIPVNIFVYVPENGLPFSRVIFYLDVDDNHIERV